MANAKCCDICGSFYILNEGWSLKEEYLLGKSTFSSGTITYDLCDKCKEKLTAFVESMMEEKHEP